MLINVKTLKKQIMSKQLFKQLFRQPKIGICIDMYKKLTGKHERVKKSSSKLKYSNKDIEKVSIQIEFSS